MDPQAHGEKAQIAANDTVLVTTQSWNLVSYNIETGAELQVYQGHTRDVKSCALIDDILFSTSKNEIFSWNVKSGVFRHLADLPTWGEAVYILVDGKFWYTVHDRENIVRKWNTMGHCVHVFQGKPCLGEKTPTGDDIYPKTCNPAFPDECKVSGRIEMAKVCNGILYIAAKDGVVLVYDAIKCKAMCQLKPGDDLKPNVSVSANPQAMVAANDTVYIAMPFEGHKNNDKYDELIQIFAYNVRSSTPAKPVAIYDGRPFDYVEYMAVSPAAGALMIYTGENLFSFPVTENGETVKHSHKVVLKTHVKDDDGCANDIGLSPDGSSVYLLCDYKILRIQLDTCEVDIEYEPSRKIPDYSELTCMTVIPSTNKRDKNEGSVCVLKKYDIDGVAALRFEVSNSRLLSNHTEFETSLGPTVEDLLYIPATDKLLGYSEKGMHLFDRKTFTVQHLHMNSKPRGETGMALTKDRGRMIVFEDDTDPRHEEVADGETIPRFKEFDLVKGKLTRTFDLPPVEAAPLRTLDPDCVRMAEGSFFTIGYRDEKKDIPNVSSTTWMQVDLETLELMNKGLLEMKDADGDPADIEDLWITENPLRVINTISYVGFAVYDIKDNKPAEFRRPTRVITVEGARAFFSSPKVQVIDNKLVTIYKDNDKKFALHVFCLESGKELQMAPLPDMLKCTDLIVREVPGKAVFHIGVIGTAPKSGVILKFEFSGGSLKELWKHKTPDPAPLKMSVDEESKVLVVTRQNTYIALDWKTGRVIGDFKDHYECIDGVCALHGGSVIATSSDVVVERNMHHYKQWGVKTVRTYGTEKTPVDKFLAMYGNLAAYLVEVVLLILSLVQFIAFAFGPSIKWSPDLGKLPTVPAFAVGILFAFLSSLGLMLGFGVPAGPAVGGSIMVTVPTGMVLGFGLSRGYFLGLMDFLLSLGLEKAFGYYGAFAFILVVLTGFLVLFYYFNEKFEEEAFLSGAGGDKAKVLATTAVVILFTKLAFVPILRVLMLTFDCTLIDGAYYLDATLRPLGGNGTNTTGEVDARDVEAFAVADDSLECRVGIHLALVALATIYGIAFTLTSLRFWKAGGDLRNIEIVPNPLNWKHDTDQMPPVVHPLSIHSRGVRHGIVVTAARIILTGVSVMLSNYVDIFLCTQVVVGFGLTITSVVYHPYAVLESNRVRLALDAGMDMVYCVAVAVSFTDAAAVRDNLTIAFPILFFIACAIGYGMMRWLTKREGAAIDDMMHEKLLRLQREHEADEALKKKKADKNKKKDSDSGGGDDDDDDDIDDDDDDDDDDDGIDLAGLDSDDGAGAALVVA